jgi:hypothetical protein
MAHEISMRCRDLGLRRAIEGVIMLTRDGNGFLPSTAIGDDLRRDPLEVRKATLASILAEARPGIIEGDGPTVFAHACKLGLFRLPFGPLARLARNEEFGCTSG